MQMRSSQPSYQVRVRLPHPFLPATCCQADALIADAYQMHFMSRMRSSAPASADNRSEVEQPLRGGGVQPGLFDSIRDTTMGVDTTVSRKRKQPDLYVPSENIRNRATGSMRRPGQQVDSCQNPQCVIERRELVAERVRKVELLQENARLRARVRAVIDAERPARAGGDPRR
jgi:hypothetical protein